MHFRRQNVYFPLVAFVGMLLLTACPSKKDAAPAGVNPDAAMEGYWLLKVVRTARPNQTEIGNYFDEKDGRMVRFVGKNAEWWRITERRGCGPAPFERNANKLEFKGNAICARAEYEMVAMTPLEMTLKYTEKQSDKPDAKDQTVTETYSRIDQAQWKGILERPLDSK